MLLPFLSLAALFNPSEAQQAREAPATTPAVELADPIMVRMPVDGDPSLAWVRAATEVGLARLSGVVPVLGSTRPAPGLERPTRGPRYDLIITRDHDEIDAALCRHASCTRWTTPATPDAPWTAAEGIVSEVAAALDRSHTPGALDRTTDGYIRDKIEVALAHQEGSAQDEAGREAAIERAIFLDPSLVVVQWLASRVGDIDDEQQLMLLRRGRTEHEAPVHLAGEAWAQQRLGQGQMAAGIWRRAMLAAPDDVRFRLPTVASALMEHDWETARAGLEGLRAIERVERHRVELADATQPEGATDEQLAAWQAVTSSTEPVRRRIELRLANGDLEGAGALAERLASRGARARAERLLEAVDANTVRGRTPLDQLDEQLDRSAAVAQRAGAVLDDLAHLQNHLLLQLQASGSCGAEQAERVSGSIPLGQEARRSIDRLDEELEALRDLVNASDIAPVLDPERQSDHAGLRRSRDRLAEGYLAAVDIQAELLEVCP